MKYPTIVWSSRSPCSSCYVDFLDNLVQDVPPHGRGQKYSPDHHVDVDVFYVVVWWTTKLSSHVEVDFLKVVDVAR